MACNSGNSGTTLNDSDCHANGTIEAIKFFVIFASNLVEPQLDVCDFGRDGVDGRIRPAGEIAHRLRRIDALRAGGLVDRERVAARRFQSAVGTSGLRVPRRSRSTTAPCSSKPSYRFD